MRIRTRDLTGDEITRAATTYPGKIAVLWSDRFQPLRGFRTWLEERYQTVKVYHRENDSHYVYLRRDADFERARLALTSNLGSRADTEFTGGPRLGAYQLSSDQPGRVTRPPWRWSGWRPNRLALNTTSCCDWSVRNQQSRISKSFRSSESSDARRLARWPAGSLANAGHPGQHPSDNRPAATDWRSSCRTPRARAPQPCSTTALPRQAALIPRSSSDRSRSARPSAHKGSR